MSNIGLVLSIAKDALAAQRYGINVTGHNIANVNTDGYSKQMPIYETRDPAPYGGVLLGRGVDTTDIKRAGDQFIEDRLTQQKSTASASQEMENYMQVMDGLFNEQSDMSISAMLADFWNMWHDIANNPSEAPERIALYEHSVLLSEQFQTLYTDLTQLETDLTSAIGTAITEINLITGEIAHLNDQIAGMETNSIANDLRDKRNRLVGELAEHINIKSFEQTNGSVTVITARGCVLVNLQDSYDLQLNGDEVEWQGSGGSNAEITDFITKGKLGGWLDMRDEVAAKYKLDLDSLAEEFVWAVNQQHSQGVGLQGFSTVTGSYTASSSVEELGTVDSGLAYYDKIQDGVLNIWVYDSNGNVDGGAPSVIVVDADTGGTTLTGLQTSIDAVANISASITNGRLRIDAAAGYTFAFSDDTSNVLAALGINTFFEGSNAGGIGVSDKITSDRSNIAAAEVYNNVGAAVAASGNTSTGVITTAGPYTGTADATYDIQISTGGAVGVAEFQWRKDGGAWSAAIVTTGAAQTIDAGVKVTFKAGNYVLNDTFSIAVTEQKGAYGDIAAGDNANALAIADIQYTTTDIAQWTCDRINGNTQGSVSATIEGYYHSMVGSVGIKSASISRSNEFNELMLEKMNEIRDSIAAVSLDEEMTSLIKYQHAYQAAAKLISVSDELLNTLISVK